VPSLSSLPIANPVENRVPTIQRNSRTVIA
jgi:hypothetical protein